MRPDELERLIRARLDALGPAPRAELLHVLMLPDLERAERIGEFWRHTETRTFGELLIDLEEDKAARAVVFGLLADMDRRANGPARTCLVTRPGSVVALARPITSGMKTTSSKDEPFSVSANSPGTKAWGVVMLAVTALFVICAVGTVLTNSRDWPVAGFFVLFGGLFAAGGVHFLRRAGKPMFEFDSTGLTYHPLDDISWKTERIPWERVRAVRYGVQTRGRFVYFDYEERPTRNWFTRAYDLVAGEPRGAPGPLAHAALPLMLSSMPEHELFQLLQDLSERHGFALEASR
jgi:hypothetical protein